MKKKIVMIYCHYVKAWLPMGRSRKKCPECGAVVGPKGGHGHKIRRR